LSQCRSSRSSREWDDVLATSQYLSSEAAVTLARIADALGSTPDEAFSTVGRETPEEAYRRGRRDGRDERDRALGAEPECDTSHLPHAIAAFVDSALSAKPSAPDRCQVWHAPNPRGTTQPLDAIVAVYVFRRSPRAAKAIYEEIAAEWRAIEMRGGAP
jgi:hypothetical protein